MTKDERTMDRLAREICWVGFSKPPECGKVAYWKSLPEETRERYRREASHFMWLGDKIDVDLMNDASMAYWRLTNRTSRCPRPVNSAPDGTTVEQCKEAGDCGCVHSGGQP